MEPLKFTINFPTRLKYAKENPLLHFYKKCMLSAYNTDRLDNIQVTAFTVNPKDYKKLKTLLEKHVKASYHFLSYRKRIFEVGMLLLDIGPRVSNEVKQGTVEIDQQELYFASFEN